MKTSLLCALRDFRPRENHDPIENFITEAFAWLLINKEGFGRFYLTKIINRLSQQDRTIDNPIDWTTRLNLGGVFPDLVAAVGDTVYLFEHKVWSILHQNQLANYRREAQKKYGQENYRLVLVTAGRHQFDQNPDLAICWHEIHEWISDWLSHESCQPDPLFEDFQTLLENEGMGPPAPVSHEAILAYKIAKPLEPSLLALIKRAVHHDWKTHFPHVAPAPKLPSYRNWLDGQDPWGRIGINLAGEADKWRAGCFLGFLLDPADHCVEWQNPQCPDFSIILNINSETQPNYHLSEPFNNFKKALMFHIQESCPEFEFLDHLAICDKPNRWHPIHIRMPMLELFRGTKTFDEQYERFIEFSSRALSCIENLPEFHAFQISLTEPNPISTPKS